MFCVVFMLCCVATVGGSVSVSVSVNVNVNVKVNVNVNVKVSNVKYFSERWQG